MNAGTAKWIWLKTKAAPPLSSASKETRRSLFLSLFPRLAFDNQAAELLPTLLLHADLDLIALKAHLSSCVWLLARHIAGSGRRWLKSAVGFGLWNKLERENVNYFLLHPSQNQVHSTKIVLFTLNSPPTTPTPTPTTCLESCYNSFTYKKEKEKKKKELEEQ